MQHKNNKKRRTSIIFWLIVIILVLGVVYIFTGSNKTSRNANLNTVQLTRQLKQGKFKSMKIEPSNEVYAVHGTYKLTNHQKQEVAHNRQNIKTTFTSNVLTNDPQVSQLDKQAKKAHVPVTIQQANNNVWLNLLVSLAPFLIIGVFFWLMFRSVGRRGGMKGILKSPFHTVDPSKDHVRFKDVAGEDAEKQELVEVVDFLKHPEKYTKLGAKIPHGVLLEGPPGTGKTLLAKAVAGEAQVPFYSVTGSDFVQMFVGVGAHRIRQLFKQARKHAPAIIFIDEIDAIGKKRQGSAGGSTDEKDQTLNQLLTEMNGFKGNQGVVVIGATNRADVLDPALTRPGRFDRKVLVDRPDVRGRYDILKVHLKHKPFAKDVDFKELARQTPGFSGADLANLLNESALLAAKYNRKAITNADVSEAEDRVIAGPAKKNAVINPYEKEIVADHEAGHATVGLVLNHARKVHKVTIIPRGRTGGFNLMLPRGDQKLLSKQNALEQLAGLLGGRVAEQQFDHVTSSGASGDLQQATKLAKAMITRYGMSKELGEVALITNAQLATGHVAYSEQTQTKIDNTIKQFIYNAHQTAIQVIKAHTKQHHAIAKALLKYETLDAKELHALFTTGHMPKDDPKLNKVQD